MSPRVTWSAPSNIAFIKYWGTRDTDRVLPYHASISMSLEVCRTTTTVELAPERSEDEIWWIDGGRRVPATGSFRIKAARHLETLRRELGRTERLRVATANSFPSSAGLASSASGFATLAVAVSRAFGLALEPGPLSVLARLSGSGSAARSVLGGYVEWPAGPHAEDGWIAPLARAEDWDLADVIAILESGPKEVSSLDGHRRAPTSPYFELRRALVPERLAAVRRAIAERSFEQLAPLLELDAIDLHVIAMTSVPPIFYWNPATLAVLAAVRHLRASGIPAAATLDAGANVHVLCPAAAAEAVAASLGAVPGVQELICDRVGTGPRPEDVDLLETPR